MMGVEWGSPQRPPSQRRALRALARVHHEIIRRSAGTDPERRSDATSPRVVPGPADAAARSLAVPASLGHAGAGVTSADPGSMTFGGGSR